MREQTHHFIFKNLELDIILLHPTIIVNTKGIDGYSCLISQPSPETIYVKGK
jgi:hypothetical protein